MYFNYNKWGYFAKKCLKIKKKANALIKSYKKVIIKKISKFKLTLIINIMYPAFYK